MTFWLMFCLSVVTVSLIPGPSTLIAFAHGARFGWTKALATASGNAAASLLQAAAASAGLGLLLAESGAVLSVVKFLGAGYLVYVGVRMWFGRAESVDIADAPVGPPRVKRRLFTDGFLVAASNPKAILFFTALFPQFLGSGDPAMGRMIVMTILVGLIAFAVAGFYAGLGARLRAMNVTGRAMDRIQKATGGLFVFAGIGIAASKT